MRKVKLDVETLAVQSFETEAEARERGTVHAHSARLESCGSCTQDYTCPATCNPYSANPPCFIC